MAEITLKCDGVEVLSVNVSKDASVLYSDWTPFQLLAFKLGDWIPVIIELVEDVRMKQKESYKKFSDKQINERAARIVLGD